MLRQRDLALAGAILAAALSVVILWRNFGADHPELGSLQHTISQHRAILAENQRALDGVHAALLADQQALAKLREAKAGTH